MREQENNTIDGQDYRCTMMPATKAHKALIELIEALGRPALVAIATGLGSKIDDGIDDVVDVATKLLFERLTPESSFRVLRMMLDGISVVTENGVQTFEKDAVFDSHFAGRMLHLYKVVGWSIRSNYSDFFDVASSNTSVSNALELAGEAFNLLTATMRSGVSAMQKGGSTSATSSPSIPT